jgi:outer membrane protein, heavy metal efflux system
VFQDPRIRAPAIGACLLLAAGAANTSADPLTDQATGHWEAPATQANGELTEEALIDQVITANPGLAALQAAAEAARYRIEPAGSLDDPVLRYAVAPRTISSGRFSQQAEFSQPIPWPGTLRERETAARHQAAAAGADVDVLRLQVIRRARTALADWRYLGEALAINDANAQLLDELIHTAERRYAAGRGARQDVLQAEIQRAELRNEALRLQREQIVVRSAINALLNRAPGTPLAPAAALQHLPEPPPTEALEYLALQRHPTLSRLEARSAARQSEVNLAEKAFYPDFQVGIGYAGLMDDPDKRPTVGVTVNVPLDRGKRRAVLDSARAEAKQSQWALTEQRAALTASITSARAGVLEARASAARYRDELQPLAAEYLDTAISDYQSGSGDFRDVLDAEQRKLQTDLALAGARASYARHLAELEHWTGAPSTSAQAFAAGAQP